MMVRRGFLLCCVVGVCECLLIGIHEFLIELVAYENRLRTSNSLSIQAKSNIEFNWSVAQAPIFVNNINQAFRGLHPFIINMAHFYRDSESLSFNFSEIGKEVKELQDSYKSIKSNLKQYFLKCYLVLSRLESFLRFGIYDNEVLRHSFASLDAPILSFLRLLSEFEGFMNAANDHERDEKTLPLLHAVASFELVLEDNLGFSDLKADYSNFSSIALKVQESTVKQRKKVLLDKRGKSGSRWSSILPVIAEERIRHAEEHNSVSSRIASHFRSFLSAFIRKPRQVSDISHNATN